MDTESDVLNRAMELASRLSQHFTSKVRTKGDSYYRYHLVRIQKGSPAALSASVAGGEDYNVQLDFREGVLRVTCTCAYFCDRGDPCKHLWATVRAADQYGYLREVVSAPDLQMLCDDELVLDEDAALQAQLLTVARLLGGSSATIRKTDSQTKDNLTQISWQRQLGELLAVTPDPRAQWPAQCEILYVVDLTRSLPPQLYLSLKCRERLMNGSWGRPKQVTIERRQIAHIPDAADREIVSALAGAGHGYGDDSYERLRESFELAPGLAGLLMPRMVATGRCSMRTPGGSNVLTPLTWEENAWHVQLDVQRFDDGKCQLFGRLSRNDEDLALSAPLLITPNLVFTEGRAAPLADSGCYQWAQALRKKNSITVAPQDQDEFLAALLSSPNLPKLILPKELKYEEVTPPACPRLRIFRAHTHYQKDLQRPRAELSFTYDGWFVAHSDPAPGFFDAAARRFLRRDLEAERAAAELLDRLGVKLRRPTYDEPNPTRDLTASKLPSIVRALVAAGWYVEAEQKVFRRPGSRRLEVSSGVDWFELNGAVDYGETTARLPELLEAYRRGEQMVQLADGTYGMLPEEWLRQFGSLVAMGTVHDGQIRFDRSQAALLDALLAAQPDMRCDATFEAFRQELRRFSGVEAAEQPEGFVGHLRDYQREGLGWLHFLRQFSFGGCLADDMGVGKTAQVLALLETRRKMRAAGEALPPSLVVVPRSLIFNWQEEARRFTPQLRLLDHSGAERNGDNLADYDVVLTTYGTLRRDILALKDTDFDYVVLDEAQAVKNASTQSAKAVRLLQGRYRLALSGTPVENHLGELWSLFEFLNPGMLGTASVFSAADGAILNADEQTRRLLSQALRPFILRRTKEQVARELPAKTEQTLYCEMEKGERKMYEELREHYRRSLLARIETEGLSKAKIQVLEALLRLRQAACHPGLLDKARTTESSAKLEALLEQLREVLEEGHKALVFSQFTSLLSIVRQRLEQSGISYEYLDGSTRDRQARVEHFQNDRDCQVFLISLKAGGLGLNLTAAEYIFILDPWWNPAVEAQAVDRAHRIGQTRPVFAYRLISRDTVEEKVLELQNSKRDLAAAIITANNSLIRNLQKEDLALLLS